ncbi:MAG: oligosaccharide flippase family protein [Actinomycetales bacterium]|nr:oligosaccharide flippase family protein [Actinomycetales bacterium]
MEEPRKALAKGLIFVGAATMIGNGAAYILSIVSARVLTPEEFGALGAMLGILIIVSTLSLGLQVLTARRVATAGADRTAVEGQAIRMSVVIGGSIIAVGLAAAWPLGLVFNIPYAALAMGLASLGFVVLGTGSMGIAQGREEHLRFSYGFIANGVGRAALGILFVLIFPGIIGVSAGILIGCALGAIISYLMICPRAWSGRIFDGGAAEFGHIAHAMIVLFTLTNVDVLMARIFLTETQSGEYSVGVLLAKIAFFLPNAIIIVLFPKMTAGDTRRAVYLATGMTAILGFVITAFSFLFGSLVIKILGGAQYADLAGEAWLFALEGSAFALVQVLLYARLAAQDRRAVASVWIALVVLVGTVALWRHDSVAQIVTTVVAVSLVLAILGLFLDRRNGLKAVGASEIVPIEAAE